MRLVPILMSLAAMGCVHLPLVQSIKPDQVTATDLVYALPRKHVLVTLKAVKTTTNTGKARCHAFLPGGAAYSKLTPTQKSAIDALGLKTPSYQGSSLVVTKATWASYAVADPTSLFKVHVPVAGGARQDRLDLAWTTDGVLTGSSYEGESKVLDYITDTLELGAGLVGTVAGLGGKAALHTEKGATVPPEDIHYCMGAVTTLQSLRNAVGDLRGPMDAASVKDVLDYKEAKLTADIATVTSLFTGEKSVVGDITCDVDVSESETDLLAITPISGVSTNKHCRVPGKLGIPATEWADNQKAAQKALAAVAAKLNTQTTYRLHVKPGEGHLVLAPPKDCASGSGSYAYRRPASMVVGVHQEVGGDTSLVSEARIDAIPQLGALAYLPRYKAAKLAATVSLDPSTGVLTAFSLSRTPADLSGAATAVGSATTTLVDAFKAKDELETLQREQSILEATIAIETAKATLGL